MNYIVIILLVFCIGISISSKILVINPIFGFSHVKFGSKLSDILADGGHDVTVLQPYHLAMKNIDGLIKNSKVEIMNYYPDHYEELKKVPGQTFPMFWDSALMTNPVLGAFMMAKALVPEFEKTATQLLRDDNLHQKLKEKQFDVVITETFDLSGLYLSHLINVPVIPFMSAVRYPVFEYLFGQPSLIGYVPHAESSLGSEAGFFDRLNDVYREFFMNMGFTRLNDAQHDMLCKATGKKLPHWKELTATSPIYITNGNPYLDFSMPSTGNIIQVGGITIPKKKKVEALPEEYETILKERESTVLISFGSVVRSYEMPDNFKSGVIEMFHNLPDVTFIWKYEKDDDELEKRLPSNVHLKKWVPQPALLADDRLKVFVTHGGLGSVMEVAYTGKPALMIPLFGDQHHNAQMLSRHGGAVSYNKYNLPKSDRLTSVLKDMVSNPKYKKSAEQLREVLKNQPIDPKVRLLNHLEFAIKFPHLKSQVPEISKVGTIAFYYLDVLLFLTLVAILLSIVSFKVVQFVVSKIFSNKAKKD